MSESSLLLYFQRVKPVYSPVPKGVPGCVLRYCAETLCRPLQNLLNGFKKIFQTYVAYADFSKAFDSVDHPHLVQKLDQLCLNLNDRTQRVIFKNLFYP